MNSPGLNRHTSMLHTAKGHLRPSVGVEASETRHACARWSVSFPKMSPASHYRLITEVTVILTGVCATRRVPRAMSELCLLMQTLAFQTWQASPLVVSVFEFIAESDGNAVVHNTVSATVAPIFAVCAAELSPSEISVIITVPHASAFSSCACTSYRTGPVRRRNSHVTRISTPCFQNQARCPVCSLAGPSVVRGFLGDPVVDTYPFQARVCATSMSGTSGSPKVFSGSSPGNPHVWSKQAAQGLPGWVMEQTQAHVQGVQNL